MRRAGERSGSWPFFQAAPAPRSHKHPAPAPQPCICANTSHMNDRVKGRGGTFIILDLQQQKNRHTTLYNKPVQHLTCSKTDVLFTLSPNHVNWTQPLSLAAMDQHEFDRHILGSVPVLCTERMLCHSSDVELNGWSKPLSNLSATHTTLPPPNQKISFFPRL